MLPVAPVLIVAVLAAPLAGTLSAVATAAFDVLGYDQSMHIPNINPKDPELILWPGEQQLNTGDKGTTGSAPIFGSRTFCLDKISLLCWKFS